MKASAFTLVELLVTIAIVAVLAALGLTSLRFMQGKADEAKCVANLRSLGGHVRLYCEDHNQRLPMMYNPGGPGSGYANPPWYSLLVPYIAPHLSSGAPVDLESETFDVLRCPADQGTVSYAPSLSMANDVLAGEILTREGGTSALKVTSPSSKGLLVESTSAFFVNPYNKLYIDFRHNRKTHVLFFDGRVQGFSEAELDAKLPAMLRPFIPVR